MVVVLDTVLNSDVRISTALLASQRQSNKAMSALTSNLLKQNARANE